MGSGGSQVRTWTRRSTPPVMPQIRAATASAGYAWPGARTGTRIRRNQESPSPRYTPPPGTVISRWSIVSITPTSRGIAAWHRVQVDGRAAEAPSAAVGGPPAAGDSVSGPVLAHDHFPPCTLPGDPLTPAKI